MTKLNIKFIILVAATFFVAIVIGLGILAVNKINDLNNEIDNMTLRLTQIGYDNNTTQNKLDNLKNEIQQQLDEQNRNYFDVSHNIISIDTVNNSARAEIYFSLKESPVTGGVEVSFGKGNQFNQVNAIKLANGKYMAELELEIDKDYEIGYSVTLSNIKTEKLLDLNIFKQLRSRFSINSDFIVDNRENWIFSFYLSNSFSENENLKISTAYLEIFKNNVLVKTVNIKDYHIDSDAKYEQYGNKLLTVNELTADDLINANITTKITVVDNYGVIYIF